MFIVSPVDHKFALAKSRSKAIILKCSVHHLIACHVIEHHILKFRFPSFAIQFIIIYFLNFHKNKDSLFWTIIVKSIFFYLII